MKAIINIDIMFVEFPAEVEFHYSETEGYVVNVHKIEILAEGYKSMDALALYHISSEVRRIINEELTDKYRGGEYEA